MIGKHIIFLVAFLGFVEAGPEIEHVVLNNDAQMISTSPNNFALSGSQLMEAGVETVSLNGDSIVLFSQQCEVSITSIENLAGDKRSLIDNFKSQLDNTRINPPSNGSVASFVFRDDTLISANTHSTYNSNSYSVHQTGQDRFSITRADLPNDLLRIFITGRVTTLVHKGGQVYMKPNACLPADMQQMLLPISLSVQQVEIYRQILEGAEDRLGRRLEATNDRLSGLATKLDDKVYGVFNSFGDQLDTRLSNLETRLSSGLSELSDKVQEKSEGLGTNLSAGTGSVLDRIDMRYSSVNNRLGAGFDSVRERIDQRQSDSKLAAEFEHLRARLDARYSALNTQVNALQMANRALASKDDIKTLTSILTSLQQKVETIATASS